MHIFIIMLITTIGVLVSLATVAWYLSVTAPSYYGSSWMSQMWGNHLGASGNYGGMGGMMGNGSGTTTTSYLWIVPVLLIVASAVAVIGVAFYLVFPELRYIKSRGTCNPQMPGHTSTQTIGTSTTANISPASIAPDVSSVSAAPNSCEVLLKTMTSEEQKVLHVLISHQGKYLQKYVVKEAGLSRLQTHRVVARFAQRGIVTVNEFGNTNEIVLSDWVK
ncbi:MAG: helix-turn-helix transcriptional regulator [Candidatus Bathyarchaeia archaeon]